MTEAALLAELSAPERSRVIAALFHINSQPDVPPTPGVMRRLVELIGHDDPDVRHRSIFLTGLRWQDRAAFPHIVAVLSEVGEELDVLTCAVGAVGTYARNDAVVRPIALHALAVAALDERLPQKVRDNANTSALWAASRISPDEYGRRLVHPREYEVDHDWLALHLPDPGAKPNLP